MKASRNTPKKLYGAILLLVAVIIGMNLFMQHPILVETYYSRKFYPVFSYLSILLFSSLPFSFGDIFYGAVLVAGCCWIYKTLLLWRKKSYKQLWTNVLGLGVALLSLYVYFNLNWGLNYYRLPLATQLSLKTDTLAMSDHLAVLDRYIEKANNLRAQIDIEKLSKNGVARDIEGYVRKDTLFSAVLAKSQIQLKQPVSSMAVSYFKVTGYLNPFTLEAHINENMPAPSYPFVMVHELCHQMGIGFEDECNFIAFLTLKDHKNPWYAYAAYYEAIQYLLMPLAFDKSLFSSYRNKLSDGIRQDLKNEALFWQQYSSWGDKLFSWFYTGYLKHNNQPEGMQRYSMMSRLVIAWELQNRP